MLPPAEEQLAEGTRLGAFVQRAILRPTQRCKDGRINRTKDGTNLRVDRRNGERDGADRARSVPMDHVCRSSRLRLPVGHGDVGWNLRRPDAGVRHRDLILGTRQALSRCRQFLSLRGTGISQQARKPFSFARIAKFTIGWASHLYYWVYPGAMVATIGIMIGYIVGNFAPDSMNAGTPGPVFMALVAIISSFAISYIAFKGVIGSTMVNHRDQRHPDRSRCCSSLRLAIAYRLGHPEGSMGLALDGTKKVLHYSFTGDTPAHPTALVGHRCRTTSTTSCCKRRSRSSCWSASSR